MWLAERPQPFEEKVQLKGAAVWSAGTLSQSSDGDACSMKYTLEFARTGRARERVETVETSDVGLCLASDTLSRAAWFGFGDGIYLRVGNELYWRGAQGRWQKHPSFDGKYSWSLSRIQTRQGQLVYARAAKGRTFYRVFQLPQRVGDEWILKKRPKSKKRRELRS